MTSSECIRTVIADGEDLARRGLRRRLSAVAPHTEIIGEARSGPQALAMVRRLAPDLVFLDLSIPDLSGADVARQLSNDGDCPVIVFLTHEGTRTAEGPGADALELLMKPVNQAHLARTVTRACAELRRREERAIAQEMNTLTGAAPPTGRTHAEMPSSPSVIRLDTGNGLVTQPQAAISHLETAGDYVCVHTDNGTLIVRSSLRQLERQLSSEQRFFRANRQTVINVERVARITTRQGATGSVAELSDGQQVPVSRRQLSALRTLLTSR
ncbi:MAG: LytTR family DNA-binding domain-containing protein [Pseudomonadota bacterium]